MNKWIVSSHKFVEHADVDKAMAEAARLAAKTGKTFHVYRIKSQLVPEPVPAVAEQEAA